LNRIAPPSPALRPLCYDYGRIEALVSSFIGQWRSDGFQAVVAIARGGLAPALMASTELGLPLYGLAYARRSREVSWYTAQQPPAGSRVLLVEDVAGRGTTLADCRAFLQDLGYAVSVFTLAHDSQSRIVPDYGVAVPAGFKAWFPWERHSITPAFAATGNLPDRPEHEYISWAIDLDGVLLADLPEDQYAAALHDTLAQRDVLPLNETLPALDLSAVTIITGRPEQDRTRTTAWLERHGFHGPLVMRDEQRHTAAQTARHKADAILSRCHTHFIESDPIQSLEIARQVKVARIVWWNGGQALLVHANEAGDLRML
jgi:hypoxanthine phosphoribosyltransferase